MENEPDNPLKTTKVAQNLPASRNAVRPRGRGVCNPETQNVGNHMKHKNL